MSMISGIVRRPVTMLVVVLLLLAFSLFSASRLSLDLLPDVEFPQAFVSTAYTGASPEEIEENITKPIEEALRGITNLEEITSQSRAGSSFVNITFKYGSGMDQNIANLNERLNRITDFLPDDASSPVVFRFSANDVPVVSLEVLSNRTPNDTLQYFKDELLVHFEQINGVSQVDVRGGQLKQVFVEPSINRLNAYNITLSDITTAIAQNSSSGSIGTISTNVSDIDFVVENKYDNVEQLKNIIVAQRVGDNNEPYYIRIQDVADVRFGYDENNKISELNGNPSISVDIYKLSGANIVDVSEEIKKTITKMEDISPQDFEFIMLDDNAVFIKDSIGAVSQAALSGGFLAVLVLILFLRNFASVLIISIAMPVSIIITLMLMYFANITINFMSLAGLALGIGMLVDNSVVVLEHIYNKRLRGVRLLSASEHGASEMARPILASTLTTVLVFAPLLLFKNELGIIGGFFSHLAFTVVISVLSSYCVAAFFVPVLTSRYLPLYRAKYKGIFKKIDDTLEMFFINVCRKYRKTLSYILLRRKRFVLFIVVIALLPLVLIPKLGFSFAPEFAPENLTIKFNFPPTAKIDDMYELVKNFEKRTEHIVDKFFQLQTANKAIKVTGRTAGSNFGGFGARSSSASLDLYYVEDVNQNIHDAIVQAYLPYINIQPGVRIRVIGGEARGAGSSSGSDFQLELKSENYDKLQETATKFTTLLEENLPNLTNIDDDQPDSALEYALVVDRFLANSYGLSVNAIVTETQTAIKGRVVGKFSEGSSEYDIRLRLNVEDRKRTDIIERLYINSARGTRVPIINVLDTEFSQGVDQIRRADFQRTLVITADLVGKYTSVQAVSDAKNLLALFPKDEEITQIFTGEYEDIQKDFKTLAIIFLLAVLFIYGIMASQFESFLDPFIIVFTVPLTFAGVILIYFLTGNTISSFTIVGVVMLSGVAVNHGIVLVDYINLLRRRGFSLKDAILAGSESRLQPILMTSATTILGLLPIIILKINGVELIKPLALTVVGGLSVSAFLSLFFIPMIYYGFHQRLSRQSDKRKDKLRVKELYNLEGGQKFMEKYGQVSGQLPLIKKSYDRDDHAIGSESAFSRNVNNTKEGEKNDTH